MKKVCLILCVLLTALCALSAYTDKDNKDKERSFKILLKSSESPAQERGGDLKKLEYELFFADTGEQVIL